MFFSSVTKRHSNVNNYVFFLFLHVVWCCKLGVCVMHASLKSGIISGTWGKSSMEYKSCKHCILLISVQNVRGTSITKPLVMVHTLCSRSKKICQRLLLEEYSILGPEVWRSKDFHFDSDQTRLHTEWNPPQSTLVRLGLTPCVQ